MTILDEFVLNQRASSQKKLIKLRGKTDKSTIIVRDFKILLFGTQKSRKKNQREYGRL